MSLLTDASLLLTPNAYKEGKLYSVIPSNGNGDFTATRATTATRVNSAGLVELVPYNLISYSEEFENAAWTKVSGGVGSLPVVTANQGTAPNGTLTADRFVVNLNGGTSGTDRSWIDRLVTGLPTSGTMSFSVWLKSNNSNTYSIVIQQTSIVGGTPMLISVTPTWQRFEFTGVRNADSSNLRIGLLGSSAVSNSADLLIWGGQLNEGALRDYIRTETRLNIPRVDYSLGGCPNILLEPQRTNLALQSSSFDNASWTKGFVSITANTTTSPSGVVDADTFLADGTSAIHNISQTISVTSGTTYSISVYAKKNTNNFIQITLPVVTFGINAFANFDLNNGVTGTIGSSATARIENTGNGWYRCIVTAPATSTGSNSSLLILVASATSVRAETNSLSTSVFLWGAQVEAGAYATSYIPTTTASVTRNIDVVQDLGVSSLIGQTEGTIYWEGTLTSGQTDDIFYLNRNVTNSVFLYKTTTNNILFRVYYGGATFTISNATAYTGLVKIAAAYKSGSSVMYINGVQAGTSATAFTFTGALTDVVLNNTAFLFGNATKYVKELALFPTRLTNAQLAALTA